MQAVGLIKDNFDVIQWVFGYCRCIVLNPGDIKSSFFEGSRATIAPNKKFYKSMYGRFCGLKTGMTGNPLYHNEQLAVLT